MKDMKGPMVYTMFLARSGCILVQLCFVLNANVRLLTCFIEFSLSLPLSVLLIAVPDGEDDPEP